MTGLFNGRYKGKKVLLTGHTGFKGSWLALWLEQLGADVIGFSQQPPTEPNHYRLLDLNIRHIEGDIRDRDQVEACIRDHQPDVIFHMAAQPLVKTSYQFPRETFDTNTTGTLNILKSVRSLDIATHLILITTDKVYQNSEWVYGYREVDALGGYDPYSASKAAAELVIQSYLKSFFNPEEQSKVKVASVRAGNVIGGGDWGHYRIVPDIVQATAKGEPVIVRNPDAIRPWQHVLEPLSGYLLLGQKLLENEFHYCDDWNFGPENESVVTVEELVNTAIQYWPVIHWELEGAREEKQHEAKLLKLDCSKARFNLNWTPVWEFEDCVRYTVKWYKDFYQDGTNNGMTERSLHDLASYVEDAKTKKKFGLTATEATFDNRMQCSNESSLSRVLEC